MIYTFGYGNRASYEQLSNYIEVKGIEYLADVRFMPYGWSKLWHQQNLEVFCEKKDIEYLGMRELGNTSGGAKWIPADNKKAHQGLMVLSDLISNSNNVILMCSELDYRRCHRTDIALRLKAMTGVDVEHLA